MNQSSSASSAVPFIDVNTGRFNDMVASIEDAADLTTSLDQLRQSVDQYYTLFTLMCLYHTKRVTTTAKHAVEALIPSMEVTIFTIGKAVAKAIFNVCKFVIHTIGKIWKFFFGFFKRNRNDIAKDTELIHEKIEYIGNELVAPSVTRVEVDQWTKIIEAHCNHLDVSPNVPAGTKVNAYKVRFFQAFNAKLPAAARVNETGAIINKPKHSSGSSKVRNLGWSNGEVLKSALHDIASAEDKLDKALKDIKTRSSEVAKTAKLCSNYIENDTATLSNEFLAEKGPQCIDAACIVTVIAKDIICLKYLENDFGRMVSVMRNKAKSYASKS